MFTYNSPPLTAYFLLKKLKNSIENITMLYYGSRFLVFFWFAPLEYSDPNPGPRTFLILIWIPRRL